MGSGVLQNNATPSTSRVDSVGSVSSGNLSTVQIEQSHVNFDLPQNGSGSVTTTLDFDEILNEPTAPEIGSAPQGMSDVTSDMTSNNPKGDPTNPGGDISSDKQREEMGQTPMVGGGGGALGTTSVDTSTGVSFSGVSAGGVGSADMAPSVHGDGSAIGGDSANGTDGRVIYAKDTSYSAPDFSTSETDLEISDLLTLDPEVLQTYIGNMTQEEYLQFISGIEAYYQNQLDSLNALLDNMKPVYDELYEVMTVYQQSYNIAEAEENIKNVVYQRIMDLHSGFHGEVLTNAGITLEEFKAMDLEQQDAFVREKDPYIANIIQSNEQWKAEINQEIATELADYNITSYEELRKNVSELEIKIEETKQSINMVEKLKASAKFDYLTFSADYAAYSIPDYSLEQLATIETDSNIIDPYASFWDWLLYSRYFPVKTYSYTAYQKKHPEVSPLEYMRMVAANNEGKAYDIQGISNLSSMKTILKASEYLPEYEKTYNYLYQQDPKLADEFLTATQYQINDIEGQMRAQQFLSSLHEKGNDRDVQKALENELGVSLEGLLDGLISFGEGVGYSVEALIALFTKNYNRTMSAEEYKRMYILYALLSPEAKESVGLLTKTTDGYVNTNPNSPIDFTKNYRGIWLSNNYEISQGIGNMLPSIGLSMINPAAGMWALGISAGGNAYHNAMVNNNDYFASLAYGVVTGLSESVTERLLGGIPGLSDFPVTSWKTYFQAMGREFTQETLQGALDLVARNKLLGEKLPDLSDTSAWADIGKDLLKQGWYGAITAGILQVPSFTMNSIRLSKFNIFLNQNSITYEQQQEAINQIRNSNSQYKNMSDVEIKLKLTQQVATQAMINKVVAESHVTPEVAKVMLALNIGAETATYMVENKATLEEARQFSTRKLVESYIQEYHVTEEEQQTAFDMLRKEKSAFANLSNEEIMSQYPMEFSQQVEINRYVMVGIKPEVASIMIELDIDEKTATYMLENNVTLEEATAKLKTTPIPDHVGNYDLSQYDTSTYGLDRIMSDNYRLVCNVFFDVAPNEETKQLLAEVLFSGKVGDFNFDSELSNKGNPKIEASRRIAMANLLIQNPETFHFIVDNKVNVFHGTRGVALSSILEKGITSLSYAQQNDIEVKTGEEWSRITGQPRGFVSFADDLGTAYDYASIDHVEPGEWNFPVILGTTAAETKQAGTVTVWSDISEIGVRGKFSAEGIDCILVPSDKIDLVKELVGNADIKVLPYDNSATFYYLNESYLEIDKDAIETYRDNLKTEQRVLELAERYNMSKEDARLLVINDPEAAPHILALQKLAAAEGLTLSEYGNLDGDTQIDPVRQLEADTLAAEKRALAEAAEPLISKDMLELSTETRRLVGYDHRLKGADSISRKILFDANRVHIELSEACDRIGDSVRYTLVCDTATFTEEVRSAMNDLIEKGYTVNHFRNTFDKTMYKGVNVSLTSPSGIVMELQFHTEQSYYAKETQSHVIYEIARNEYTSPEAKRIANIIRKIVASKIDMPPDVMSLTEAEFKK